MQQRCVQLSKKCAFRPTSLLTRSNTPMGQRPGELAINELFKSWQFRFRFRLRFRLFE